MKQIKCPECDKIIEGYTEKHINFLLGQHLIAKHKMIAQPGTTQPGCATHI